MKRTAVNPVTWSQEMGFNQGEVVEGEARTLYISGQTAMDKDGRPEHDGDIAAQLALAVLKQQAGGLHSTLGHQPHISSRRALPVKKNVVTLRRILIGSGNSSSEPCGESPISL